jgi:hypothetical protein
MTWATICPALRRVVWLFLGEDREGDTNQTSLKIRRCLNYGHELPCYLPSINYPFSSVQQQQQALQRNQYTT